MNASLFYDLHKIINTPYNFNIEKDVFLLFLLNGDSKSSMNLYERADVEPCLKMLDSQSFVSLRSIFGRQYDRYLRNLESSCKLDLDNLIGMDYSESAPIFIRIKENILSCKDEIYELYKRYSIPMPQEKNVENLLSHLFIICISEQNPFLFASCKNQQLKPKTIKSTLGRENDAKYLRALINKYHKIIVYGQYGMGKSRFIQYCLSTWKLPDYYYIHYETDLASSLKKIRYQGINGVEYTNASDFGLFNNDFTSSLLIIDNMYSSPDFYTELERLSNMAINIIVITVNNIPKESLQNFYHYELPPLPNEILYKIFENDSGLSLKNEMQKTVLSDITFGNILLLSLIAFQCKKLACNLSIQINATDIIQQVLEQFSNLSNHINLGSQNSKFKHQYDKKTLDLIGHIKNVYGIILQNTGSSLKETMKQLCCFGCSPIPLEFVLSVILNGNINLLEELSKIGLLILGDETVQITPLISHAVFATENPNPLDYDRLVENLITFLRSYDKELNVPYLSDSLYIFIQSLYDSVPSQNNPTQKNTSSRFEDWQELSYLIINYYNQNNAAELAQKVTTLIQYPVSLKNSHNKIDKSFFDIADKMQIESEFSNVAYSIDDLINSLQSTQDINPAVDMSSLIFNALDNALNLFCRLSFSNEKFCEKKANNYIYVMKQLLQHSYNIQNRDDILNLPLEKLSFYKGCLWLITNPDISPDDFENSLNFINSWKNTDYRIRALAFIIFSQSVYSYKFEDNVLFNNAVLPNIQMLDSIIQSCKLIPIHTFHLCLNAYIEAAKEQYVFTYYGLNKSNTPNILGSEICHNLFNRCNITKEIYDEAMTFIEYAFQMIEN